MQKVKLGCHIIQIRGVSYKPEDVYETLSDDSVILLRANNIKDGKINFDDVVYVNRLKVKSEQFLKKGDILICTSSGSKELVGKAAYITADYDVVFGAFCKVLRSIDICAEYLGHYFQSDYYKGQIMRSCQGANINNLRAEHFNELLIKLPLTEEKQKAIAKKLDKVVDLIEKRKKQIEKLDELVKSRFIEMFGDCLSNNFGWDLQQGNKLFKFSSGKFLSEDKRLNKGVPVYGGNGIVWYTKSALVNFPTIIIGRVGVYCGNVNVVLSPVWVTDNAIYIKEFLNKEFNVIFLYYLMINLNFSRFADYSGQPKITQKPLENIKYIIPPIELQNKFAEFVEKVEKTKSAIKKSLYSLETLKKSLMQKYFG